MQIIVTFEMTFMPHTKVSSPNVFDGHLHISPLLSLQGRQLIQRTRLICVCVCVFKSCSTSGVGWIIWETFKLMLEPWVSPRSHPLTANAGNTDLRLV